MLIIDSKTTDQILALQQEYENSAANGEFSDFFYFEFIDKLDTYDHYREDVDKFLLSRNLHHVSSKYWINLILNATNDDINLSQFNEVVYLVAAYYAAKSKDDVVLIKLLEISSDMDLDSDTFSLVIDVFINDNYTKESAEIIIDFVRSRLKHDNFKHVYYGVISLNKILSNEQLIELEEMALLTTHKGNSVAVISGLLHDIVYYLIVSKQFHILSLASREVVTDNLENNELVIAKDGVDNFDELVTYAGEFGINIVEYDSDLELEKVYKELGLDSEDDYNEDDFFDEDEDILREENQYRKDIEDANMHGSVGHVHHAGCNHGKQNESPFVRDGNKTGRNEDCICGSGKKYKKCCL